MYCPKGPNGQNKHKCLKNGVNGVCAHHRNDKKPEMSATYLNNCNNNPSMDQMVDRTPCGSATLTPNMDESYDTPPYIRWSQDFHYLLNDGEGIQLFRQYLKSEGLEQLLDFWFACEGLKTNKTEDKEVLRKLINVIYKKLLIKNSKIIDLSDNVWSALKQVLPLDATPDDSEPKCDRNVFDSAQNEVEEQLKNSIYVNFLRSDIYLNYLQSNAFPNSHSVTDSSYDKTEPKDNSPTVSSMSSLSMESSLEDYNSQSSQYYVLPTVDEESELQTTESSVNRRANDNNRSQTQNRFVPVYPVNPCHNLMSSGSNDTLMRGINRILSQRSTHSGSARLTTEAHPLSPNHNRVNPAYQSYLRSKSMANPPNPYHVKYATVLPTSARDSELQSISSHSTNDSMSCVSGQDTTDINGIRTKKQNFVIKQNAKLNSNANNMNGNNPGLHIRAIRPGTAFTPNNPDPLQSDQFSTVLKLKLQELKKIRENYENNDKKLTEMLREAYVDPNANKSNPSVRASNPPENSGCRPNKTLKEVLKERTAEHKELVFCPPEDNDQEILDKHFAQVFSETPNETPTDSIGRCVSPPKQNNFKPFDNRMTPPVTAPMAPSYDSTQIGVTVKYSTERIPYRLTLTGPHITLRKFKQQIPAKRGNWQFYFKRKCTERELIDISAAHVLEKICDDNALLPLIDGKIFAEIQESN